VYFSDELWSTGSVAGIYQHRCSLWYEANPLSASQLPAPRCAHTVRYLKWMWVLREDKKIQPNLNHPVGLNDHTGQPVPWDLQCTAEAESLSFDLYCICYYHTALGGYNTPSQATGDGQGPSHGCLLVLTPLINNAFDNLGKINNLCPVDRDVLCQSSTDSGSTWPERAVPDRVGNLLCISSGALSFCFRLR